MNPPTVILACGAIKGPVAVPALDLYRGPYYLDCRRWALSVTTRDHIYILSALHGLVPAAQVPEPYDQSIYTADAYRLAMLVRSQAGPLLEPCTAVGLPWFAGGAAYLEVLASAGVEVRPVSATLPPGRATRGIGAQRSWYLSHLGELPGGVRW
jgi:hypothetical protein